MDGSSSITAAGHSTCAPPHRAADGAKLALVLGLAAGLRLVLLSLSPAWAAILAQRVELTNDFVGMSYIREAAFLLRMKVRVYEYGNALPMPLIVGLLDAFSSPIAERLLLTGLDLGVAVYLWRIAQIRCGTDSAAPLRLAVA